MMAVQESPLRVSIVVRKKPMAIALATGKSEISGLRRCTNVYVSVYSILRTLAVSDCSARHISQSSLSSADLVFTHGAQTMSASVLSATNGDWPGIGRRLHEQHLAMSPMMRTGADVCSRTNGSTRRVRRGPPHFSSTWLAKEAGLGGGVWICNVVVPSKPD